MKRKRTLSGEETRLWATIARTAKPLKGKLAPELPETEDVSFAAALAPPQVYPPKVAPPPPAAFAPPVPSFLPPYMPSVSTPKTRLPHLHPIERPVRRKIGKGRIALDDRIDLHGQTEATAHDILLFFLRRAQAGGLRHVLVITGRGASFGSTGTLKRAMPHWFSTPEFRLLVAGYEPAERGHGGEGAFYVRVRRK